MKHRWRWVSTKGDSVWKHLTWRCARCRTTATCTVPAEKAKQEAKFRPSRTRTYGVPADCGQAAVEGVQDT